MASVELVDNNQYPDLYEGVEGEEFVAEEEDNDSWLDKVSAIQDSFSMSYGEAPFLKTKMDKGLLFSTDLEATVLDDMFSKYDDYQDNIDSYRSYANETDRYLIDDAIKQGRFYLDEFDEVQLGQEATVLSRIVHDMDSVKGALLARKYGYTEEIFDAEYKNYVNKKTKEYQARSKDANIGTIAAGMIAGVFSQDETIKEVMMSPQKVVGTSWARAALKRMGYEGAIASIFEPQREINRRKHQERLGTTVSLRESAGEIAFGIGVAAVVGGAASAMYDWLGEWKAVRKALKENGEVDKADIIKKYYENEIRSLHTSGKANDEMLDAVEKQINKGEAPNVEGMTNIDINTRTSDDVEPISIDDIVEEEAKLMGRDKHILEGETSVDDLTEVSDGTIDNPYGSIASKADGDKEIEEAIANIDDYKDIEYGDTPEDITMFKEISNDSEELIQLKKEVDELENFEKAKQQETVINESNSRVEDLIETETPEELLAQKQAMELDQRLNGMDLTKEIEAINSKLQEFGIESIFDDEAALKSVFDTLRQEAQTIEADKSSKLIKGNN